MNETFLFTAVILMWAAVVVGTWQHIFQMPAWFRNPPASFELIRRQSRAARMFWVPLSVVFMLFAISALVVNWQFVIVRNYILLALACYGLTGVLSAMYFVREIIAFSKMPANEPQTKDLLWRTRTWLRWTTVRDILQLFAAIFLTLAYNNLWP